MMSLFLHGIKLDDAWMVRFCALGPYTVSLCATVVVVVAAAVVVVLCLYMLISF